MTTIANAGYTVPSSKPRHFAAIFCAWIVAGTFDISDALIYYRTARGVHPSRLLQNIATGVIGQRAFSGGRADALLGLALHYLIALGATIVFYLLSRKIWFMTRHAVAAGLIYGLGVYLFMNFVVLPNAGFSHPHIPTSPILWITLGNAILAVMICIGLTISLIVRKISPKMS
jgi:hypothetical protein